MYYTCAPEFAYRLLSEFVLLPTSSLFLVKSWGRDNYHVIGTTIAKTFAGEYLIN